MIALLLSRARPSAAVTLPAPQDILAWRIDPSRGQAGFSPHRDRQPDDAAATFRADGSARYATLWVPFVDATPDNSCLYCIPK